MDDGRDIDRAELIRLARQVCFLLTLLGRVEAGEWVPPAHAAMLSQLSPDFLELLADLLTKPAPCVPATNQPVPLE